ncbi:MAG: glycosyltransferase family 4 protein [Acidobacteria bacterium]|nr:glycosyltransferase family 4 protein [Acidobacteriota bacterium]MCA1650868.1 glycosyltransferase family 4 protein [Acidobacteriota bacterium]
MRILYFADIRFPLERANGIQTMETCHALAVRGHTVQLVVRPDTHAPARDPFAYYGLPAECRLVIERVPTAGRGGIAARIAYLAFAAGRAPGRGRADVVFTRDLGVASLMTRLPAGGRPPLVYESHGYAPEVAAALPDLIATARKPSAGKLRRLAGREARVWRVAEGYVTITRGLADEMTRRFGERARLAVVPDGVRIDSAWGADVNAEPGVPPLVVYVGHLYAWKGVDILLQAIERLPDVHGLIVGGLEREPDLARLKSLAARLGIEKRVTFTGLVEPPRVPDLLRRATVLALPNTPSAISTQFTSPLKLFEYMAAGRPIVASNLPALSEMLEDGVNALLVAAGDPEALAAAIRRIVDDPALGRRLAAASLKGAPTYGWDKRAERIEALIADVTGAVA